MRLVADDRLRYEPAAQIIATCSSAGVASIRLSPPGSTPVRSGAAEPGASPRGRGPARPLRHATRGLAMNGRRLSGILLLGLFLAFTTAAAGQDTDADRDPPPDDRLGLADLAAYRAAPRARRPPTKRGRPIPRPRSDSATCGPVPTPIAAAA